MVNLSYKNDDKADERLDPSAGARDLYHQEHESIPGYDRANDGLDDHPVSAGDTTNPNMPDKSLNKANKNIDAVRDREVNSPNWTTNVGGGKAKEAFTLKTAFAGFKKKGPIGAIIALAGLGGGALLGTGGILPVNLGAIVENFYGNSSRASQRHYEPIMRYKVGNKLACANPVGLKCAKAGINDKTLQSYKDKGFKVESDKFGKRNSIKSITFPDGTKVNSGDAFVAHINASTPARSSAFGVFNPRSGPYVGTRFTKLLQKFGLAKNKIVISGDDREATARSFDREAGQPDDETRTADADRARSDTESEIKGKTVKAAGKVTNVLGLACGTYDMTRVALGLVKAKNAAKYIAFGWFFLKFADQMRAGDVDPGTATAVGVLLTSALTSGDDAGKTAMDSPGVKAMQYGDRGTLSSTMQNILLGGNPVLKKLDDTMVFIKNMFGAKTAHTACRASSDPFVGTAMSAAMCTGGGGAAGTIVPGLGTAIGGLAGGVVCTLSSVLLAVGGSLIVGYIIEQLMPILIDYLASVELSYEMPPVDAGNALTIGAGLLFAGTGLSSGMKLGTKSEAEAFTKITYENDKQYEEVARYDARNTPFDVNNQYSFMGQFVSQIGLAKVNTSNPVTSTLTSIGSILSGAQLSLFSTAANATSMPSSLKSETLGECADPELAEKNKACDTVGGVQTVQSAEEMDQLQEQNLDYMISNEYVADNEEGTVNPDKDYAKYLKYCTGEGTDLPGTSTMSIAEEDYIWPDERCDEESQMIKNFRTYTARTGLDSDMDTYHEDAPAEAAADTTTPGGADIAGDDYAKEVRKVLGRGGTGQCVDFVLFRLVKHKVLKGPIALGNGKDVVGTLGRMGYKVNTTPAVHSVMSTARTSTPQYGHTAMVSQVNSDGSIVVEEYNYNTPLHYGTRTISAAEIKSKAMTFAHTEVDYK